VYNFKSNHGAPEKNGALQRSIGFYMCCTPKDKVARTYFNCPSAFIIQPVVQGTSVYGDVWKLKVNSTIKETEYIFMYRDSIENHNFFYLV